MADKDCAARISRYYPALTQLMRTLAQLLDTSRTARAFRVKIRLAHWRGAKAHDCGLENRRLEAT
jgi:hypothetical protein